MKMYRVKKYRKFPKTKSKGSSYTNRGQLEGGSNNKYRAKQSLKC